MTSTTHITSRLFQARYMVWTRFAKGVTEHGERVDHSGLSHGGAISLVERG